MSGPVREGQELWTPSAEQVTGANITAFQAWLAERGHRFDSYDELWQWSVDDLEGFWQAIWDYSGIQSSAPPERVLRRAVMPDAEWSLAPGSTTPSTYSGWSVRASLP